MGLFKLKNAMIGLTSVFAATSLFADAPVDMTFDNNQNEFEQYWYYYDDNVGVGDNDRPQAAPTLKPSVINVEYTKGPRKAFDNASDTWEVKTYTFKTDKSSGKNCATVPFTMGDMWNAGYCAAGAKCATPFIGLGTMLAVDKKSTDLTGATHVKFLIKSRKGDLPVRFKIQTLDIDVYANKPGADLKGDEFGYYGTNITATPGDWQEHIIDISKMKVPGTWAHDFDFDITKCTKLAWEVTGDGDLVTVDTLDVTDVQIIGEGFKWVSPSVWTKTEEKRPSGGWFQTFDTQPRNQTPLMTYWYAYNDGQIGGKSSVTEDFAKLDAKTGLLQLEFADGSGFEDKGYGTALEFELGSAIKREDVTIEGFVGIGCNVYDSAKSEYFDIDAEGAKSIYFEYMADVAKYVTLEISDMSDVGDADAPDRKESRGSGIVYFRNFPSTAGEWKRVEIPFDSLVVQSGWIGYKEIPFDTKKLAKIQWKVQGAEGSTGIFAIDNIAFPGADFGVAAPKDVSVKRNKKELVSGFNAKYSNGMVRVNWNNSINFTNGKINLFNINGAIVKSVSIPSAKNFSATLSTEKLSAGQYFVRLNAVGANGKAVTKQSSLNIMR